MPVSALPSALSIGATGLTRSAEQFQRAAEETVAAGTVGIDPDSVELSDEARAALEADPPSLERGIVGMKAAGYGLKASAAVVRAADEQLGTLLDIVA